jgi:hypothetical protein
MSQEDFNQLLEVFQKLKQWRDEKDAADKEAIIRSGAPTAPQDRVRIH